MSSIAKTIAEEKAKLQDKLRDLVRQADGELNELEGNLILHVQQLIQQLKRSYTTEECSEGTVQDCSQNLIYEAEFQMKKIDEALNGMNALTSKVLNMGKVVAEFKMQSSRPEKAFTSRRGDDNDADVFTNEVHSISRALDSPSSGTTFDTIDGEN